MEFAITVCLLIVGLINFVPVVGIIGAEKIESAYSIEMPGADLQILMRHRALLFGVLGGFILFAAFNPVFQWPAMIMAAISMIGFAVLVLLQGQTNSQIRKVLIADVIGIAFLALAVGLKIV